MSQGNGRGGGKKKSKNKSKVSISAPPPVPTSPRQDQHTAIEDLVTSPTAITGGASTVVVNMEPPTPSTETSFHQYHPQPQKPSTASAADLLGSPSPSAYAASSSPKPIYYEENRRPSLTHTHSHQHEHPEPSIGERFGRRHGQDWPTPPHHHLRCASCPGSRSESRSESRGGMRRTSGNEILDSFAEVEEVLREHREEEDEMNGKFPQLPNVRSGNDLLDITAGASTANGGNYGSTCGSATPNNGGLSTSTSQNCLAKDAVVVAMPTKSVGEEDDEVEGDEDEESAPLIDGYVRKKRTSPKLVQLAINVSFMANVFLVIIKIWTVLFSDSLAVLASMIDSLMDLLSGAIIWYSARLRSNTTDGHRYPVGKARMEPLGIIVFAAVMVTSFMQVMLQAFERLVEGSEEPPVDLGLVILLLLALNIVIKFLLWLWCRTMKDSSSVLALAQDHLNDVVFNVFSTFFPVAGQYLGWWWLDAVGAIVLSIYIISEWTRTCLHNIRRLTGQAASPAEFQQLTYMAYRFSNMIQAIDTVRAYYAGDGLFVEIDIVLPPDTPLSQAHDLGESLQSALERLDNVERAFVHIDYNTVHAIEHR
ncbi:hypothetical protein BGZ91_005642 [Linnemannia elongata]|nr:hypothetical protein BGZ91_005642 [Linnemannia elongata]